MASLKGFWRFLNTDVKEIPWGELTEKGIEAVSAAGELGEKWEEHKNTLNQLEPYFEKVEPVFKILSDPDAQMVVSGLPFVSVGIGLLKLYLNLSKTEPTFASSVILVAQLAYLQSLEAVLERVTDTAITDKLAKVSLQKLLEKQITQLETDKLSSSELKIVTSRFRESKLAEQFEGALTEQLQQAGLEAAAAQKLAEDVGWGTPRYLYQAIAEAGDSVEPLAKLYRTGGKQEQDRYVSIDAYLKEKIAPLPTEQVFDESNPPITFDDIYVPLKVKPLEQSGEEKNVRPINIHDWAQGILEQTGPRKVMFIQGDAGQGKSVFCRMFAAEVCQDSAFFYIPLFIRLRNLRVIENNLTKTLEDCPELELVEFVGREGWLKDKNIRFLIILDGFDELLLQGRSARSLQILLQRVLDFQKNSHHQCLLTGRSLALQGVAQHIIQDEKLDRVKLQPMDDSLREQWLCNWQEIFGENDAKQFQKFLKNCPEEINANLAREPLLIYLLARLHRENQLTSEMFADAKQESQAKLRIYRESVNWVLEKQRQDQNLRLSGLDDSDDLREVLQEAALCVVQSGNKVAELSMLKARFQDSENPVATSLKTVQETTKQSEDKVLNNLLATFYLRPGGGDKRGSVEFTHNSFSEYLFAERLITAFENWTELERSKSFRLNDQTLYEQIYDLLGFGGLSVEIVEYVFELLGESEIDRVGLFQRLHTFYECWCEGEFLNQEPTGNLPQKKLLQLKDYSVSISLNQINALVGLNILIILFKLAAVDQLNGSLNMSENAPTPHIQRFYSYGEFIAKQFERKGFVEVVHYPDFIETRTFAAAKRPNSEVDPNDYLTSDIQFHPCEKPSTENFDRERLLKIIHYGDSLGSGTFSELVGPHLSNANLSNANLSNANLSNANLSNANLSKVDLERANLSGANLNRANLERAYFNRADLSNANLRGASLNRANLNRANLKEADFSIASLFKVKLSRANLQYTNLSNVNLCDANLSSANLDRANLCNANLSNANFDRADLNYAKLDSADLYSTDLENANLYSANLNNASLVRANLSSANFTNANLSSANFANANLSSANFTNAILLNVLLSTVENLTRQQLEGNTPPIICNANLPPVLKAYQDRDRNRLPAILHKRYPKQFESLEAAEKYINEQYPPAE
ncbi:pentapeptide repeat-containing protein [Leptothoe sp. ISB3NOV94-8A]